MKKILLTLITVAVLVFIFWAFKESPLKVEIIPVEKTIFREELSSEGYVRSRTRETVSAFADGDIEKIDLKTGDLVKKGQLITTLKWDVHKRVTVPFSGVVTNVFHSSPGPVQRGQPLIEVAAIDDLEVVIELLTSDAVRVKPGQSLMITGWGGKPILSKVLKVSRAGFTKVSALGVEEERTEVIADLGNLERKTLARLGDNYHVDCTILLSEIPNSLVIPVGALFRQGTEWAVFRVAEGRARARVVQVGERGLSKARIILGLNEGDLIINFPEGSIEEGTRVETF